MRSAWMLGLATALVACAPAAPGPEKPLVGLYAPYISHAAETGVTNWDAAPVYSESFKAAIDRGLEYGRLLNEPVIDFDPIANGQDFSLSNLNVAVDQAPQNGKAHVTAHFDDFGKPDAVGYDMIEENGAWKIDNIHDGPDDLRGVIEQNLKPLGDPEAMKAPITTIYEMYASPHSGAATPLYRWAPLSKSFAPLMQTPAAKTIKFDPVTDGADLAAATIDMEAASSAVIVRLKAGAARHVIVYDVIEEDGAWKVDDIRAPEAARPWDLRTLLEPSPH